MKSMLWNLIQDIEPLDLSTIQKDVAPETVDAMKRTISGMLGLLPSDQFRVVVEALWNPFFKLLVSSIMTGYTLCNAEYRLSFERNLELSEEDSECSKSDISEDNHYNINLGSPVTIFKLSEEDLPQDPGKHDEEMSSENMGKELGDLTPQAEEYISQMQSRLDAMKKELHDLRRKNSALQMQQFVGEEKNDLLDYLRSLTPEKPLISVPRDYLARLLFWCMLLGHYIRGLEYRLELTQLLRMSSDVGSFASGDDHVI
ncbi:hypothetical protein PR202_ga12629 [Eleusine coracana subsp. coracana]|uniref:Uncharacterized protein n=1 Tax=Eleusine coracana subsp. coracana TaxID=191504 RepID=A0AAV5CC76_ELECO|nr:hypothetical protein PR202_ga12629 [Eleusine coracana subsp. coracana]